MSAQYKITPAALRKNKMQKERISYHLAKIDDKTLNNVSLDQLEGLKIEENKLFTEEDEMGTKRIQKKEL